MAAPMTCVTFSFIKQLKRLQIGRFVQHSARKLTVENDEEYEFDPELEERLEFEKKLAKMRDCSGLSDYHKKRMYGQMQDFTGMKNRLSDKRFYQRRLFALYGSESGINPGIMWPSKAELQDLKDIERDFTPTFQEMMQRVEERKILAAEEQRQKEERVEKAMARMDSLIKQYQKKQAKTEEAGEARGQRVKDLLDEFRETYGFSVTKDSPKFKAFKSMKVEELKQKKKRDMRLSKKEQSQKQIQMLLEQGSGSKY